MWRGERKPKQMQCSLLLGGLWAYFERLLVTSGPVFERLLAIYACLLSYHAHFMAPLLRDCLWCSALVVRSIVGSRVDVYLLEKSRVVHQLVGERNYHAFYQLLAAQDEHLPGAQAQQPLCKYK